MSEPASTQIQKHFLISSVYRRSRRYFDIARLNQLQHQQQLIRRMPQSSNATIDSRLSGSFVNSNDLLNSKVNHDIDYFHSKAYFDEHDDTDTTYTAPSHRKTKTIDMRKMLPRCHISKDKPKTQNQEQFNNFIIKQHQPRKSLDFDTYIGRFKEGPKTQRYSNPEQEQSYSKDDKPDQINKVYVKNQFDQSHYRCFVDYQKNGKTSPKPQTDESPVYDNAKVRRGENLTRKTINANLNEFYHGNGKGDPSQFDNRLSKENQYYWRGVRQERQRLKDFTVLQRKEDELVKRMNKLLQRKQLPDDKRQMCDQKFFRRNPYIQ